MNKWDIKIWLKNGAVLEGVYIGDEDTSGQVASRLFEKSENQFVGIGSNGMNLFYKVGEVSAFCISVNQYE